MIVLHKGLSNDPQCVLNSRWRHVEAQSVADDKEWDDEIVIFHPEDKQVASTQDVMEDCGLWGCIGTYKGQDRKVDEQKGEVIDHHLLFDFHFSVGLIFR